MGHFVPRRKHDLTGGHSVLFYGSLMNRHAKILQNLGGNARVASLLGMRENTVSKWRRRGIPSQHWHRIIALAPYLTPEYLDRTKPRGSQRRCQAAE